MARLETLAAFVDDPAAIDTGTTHLAGQWVARRWIDARDDFGRGAITDHDQALAFVDRLGAMLLFWGKRTDDPTSAFGAPPAAITTHRRTAPDPLTRWDQSAGRPPAAALSAHVRCARLGVAHRIRIEP